MIASCVKQHVRATKHAARDVTIDLAFMCCPLSGAGC
jgi:hypothetical protein